MACPRPLATSGSRLAPNRSSTITRVMSSSMVPNGANLINHILPGSAAGYDVTGTDDSLNVLTRRAETGNAEDFGGCGAYSAALPELTSLHHGYGQHC